jgi:6-phosphogluconolactonase
LYVLSQGSSEVESYAVNLTSGNLSLINAKAKTDAMPSSIILDPTGAVAFVLNAGSNDITGYTINKDGSLTEASGNTTTGQNAVAMARDAAGKFLFVITQEPHLYVFTMQSGSTSLSLASQTTLTRTPTGIAAIAGPNSTVLLYVSSNKDLAGTNDNTVSEYSVDASGAVAELAGSPYTTASNPSAVAAAATSPIGGSGGLFVYVANVTTNSVSVYQVCTVQNATCTQQNVTDLTMLSAGTPVTVGSNPVAMVVDPKSNFLYVASKISNQVFGFRINATQGTLGALSPANLSTGSEPIAIAMHSSGKFLFVSNNASSNISSFTVDTTSGAMSAPITITSAAQPAGLASK